MALFIPATPAVAATKAQKMAQARAVKSQIDRLDTQSSIAEENYLVAASRHAALLKQTQAAQRRINKARKRIGVLQTHLGTRASDMYRTGPMGFIDVLLGAQSFDQLATTWDLLKSLNRDDAQAVVEMKAAKAEAAAAHKEFAAKEQDAKHQQALKNDALSRARSALSTRKAKLAGIEKEIKAIDAAQRAAALAAARQGGGSGGGGGGNYPPPTNAPHGGVVGWARSRIGCPYVWAASGPSSFDCSGLMMWCYAKVGISLPHSSRAQINVGQRVSKANLQPGDLVFFGSPIHHVGMYVGGGTMIEAPYTGARVRYASAFRSDYAGACRP